MTGQLALHVCDLRQPSMQAAMRDVQNGDQAPTGSSYALHVAPTQKSFPVIRDYGLTVYEQSQYTNMYTEIRNIPEDIKSQREKFSVYFTLSVVTNPFRGLSVF